MAIIQTRFLSFSPDISAAQDVHKCSSDMNYGLSARALKSGVMKNVDYSYSITRYLVMVEG